jgi:glucose-6-phosphate isomerase
MSNQGQQARSPSVHIPVGGDSVEDLMWPFALAVDLQRGGLEPCNNITERHLSDMRGMYIDEVAAEEAIAQGDPLLYEVNQYDVPFETGQLLVVTTVIRPGRVGDEYYMTKGHFHEQIDRAEVYVGLQGQGCLLLETAGGESLPTGRTAW